MDAFGAGFTKDFDHRNILVNFNSELLREPNLLVTGKKPTGLVKADLTHPLLIGCKSWWPMLAQDVNIIDYVGTNHGVLTYGAKWEQSNVKAENDGEHVLLKRRPAEGLVGNNFTCVTNVSFLEWDAYEAWIKGTDVNEGFSFRLASGATSKIAMYLGTGSTMYNHSTQHGMSLNTWYQLAATYDGISMKLYKDGELLGIRTVSINVVWGIHTEDDNFFGRPNAGTLGYYSNFAIWNRTLDITEINQLRADPYQMLVPA